MSTLRKFDSPVAGISGRIFWLILSAMIIMHIIVFVFYSQRNSRAELKVNHDIVTQQTMHVVETILQASPDKQQTVVDAIDVPGLHISINKRASYKTKIRADSLWPILVALRKQQQHLEISIKLDHERWLNVYATIIKTSWTLQAVLLFLEMVVAGIVLFFIWSISRFAIPLKVFMKAADRVGMDIESPPIVVSGPKIVRDTAHAMNQMQKRIHVLIRERTQMLAAMSHDLRTPITRLKLRLQFLDDKKTSRKMLSDLNEMEEMVNETLSFAREDSKNEAKTKLDLSSLLESICLDYQDIGKNVTFTNCEQRSLVMGRRIALKRAFNNIIDNALKYAGTAWVSIKTTKDVAQVIVEDDGPGIPESELEKVLRPFYRGEKSRSRDTGGAGLGLAVTQDIILAHQGNIELQLRHKRGLRVIVTLPKYQIT